MRDRMGMSFLDDLHLVFGLTQKTVRFSQLVTHVGRDEFMPRKLGKCGHRAGIAQLRFVAAVEQLQRLCEKLDLANTAIAQFDITFLSFAREQLVLDSCLHVPQLIDGCVVEIAAINKRLDLLQEVRAERLVAGHGTRFYQRRSLPTLAPGFVVEHCRAHRLHERAVGTKGAKAQIDTQDDSVFGHLAHRLDDSFADFGEKIPWALFAFSTPCAFALVALKEKNDIHIRAEIELAAAKFSHAENDEAIWLFCPWQIQQPVIFLYFGSTEPVGAIQ